MVHTFADLTSEAGLKELDSYLDSRSYIDEHQASRDDLAVYAALAAAPDAKAYPNAARWYSHVTALLGSSFPGAGAGVQIAAPAEKKKVKKEVVARTQYVVEITSADPETPTDELVAKEIKGLKIDGLYWAEDYKIVPIGFGIEQVVIGCVVEDAKIESVQDLLDKELTKNGESESIGEVRILSYCAI